MWPFKKKNIVPNQWKIVYVCGCGVTKDGRKLTFDAKFKSEAFVHGCCCAGHAVGAFLSATKRDVRNLCIVSVEKIATVSANSAFC